MGELGEEFGVETETTGALRVEVERIREDEQYDGRRG
jgi:hypothetical protein